MISLIFHPIYSRLHLPTKHRFPIEKYQALQDKLVAKGVSLADFIQPSPITPELLGKVYVPNYVKQLVNGELAPKAMRRIGFPWSEQLIERSLTAIGGTILAAEKALDSGCAINLTGGYHHAFANYGSGFCLFNDLYLAALKMLQTPAIKQVLIIDLDVHQGDGTAKLASQNPHVFTFSAHGEKNFPYRKQVSDLDIPLVKGIQDDEYLSHVSKGIVSALKTCKPDAVIYDAGVDIHIDDDLGLLNISTDGVLARDSMVFEACRKEGLPVAAVIGGGYQRDIQALTDVHLQLFYAAGVI